MSNQEYNDFLSKLYNAIIDFCKIKYDIIHITSEKIKIQVFLDEEWGDEEINILKDGVKKAGEDLKDDFEKFHFDPIPTVEFWRQQCCAVVKWRMKN